MSPSITGRHAGRDKLPCCFFLANRQEHTHQDVCGGGSKQISNRLYNIQQRTHCQPEEDERENEKYRKNKKKDKKRDEDESRQA